MLIVSICQSYPASHVSAEVISFQLDGSTLPAYHKLRTSFSWRRGKGDEYRKHSFNDDGVQQVAGFGLQAQTSVGW